MNIYKLILLALVILMAQACASYTVEKTHDDNTVTKVKIKAIFHKVEDVEATYGGFHINIGSAGPSTKLQDFSGVMCLLYPHLCPTPGSKLSPPVN